MPRYSGASVLFIPLPRQTAVRATVLGAVICLGASLPAASQQVPNESPLNLDDALSRQLAPDCSVLLNGGPPGNLAAQLQALCAGEGPTAGGGQSAGGTATTTRFRPSGVQERLSELRPEAEGKGVEVAALGTTVVAETDEEVENGLSAFIIGSYENLDRTVTYFEDGYDSDAWDVTVGVDYRFMNWLTAGFAFNVDRWRGDFASGGDFATDSYGPMVYGSMSPLPGLFVDVLLSYAYADYDRTRLATWSSVDERGIPTRIATRGLVTGNYNGDQFAASALIGYDRPLERFTIGLRGGFGYAYQTYDDFSETGRFLEGFLSIPAPTRPERNPDFFNPGTPTGLELAFQSDSQTSLQSILGAQISTTLQVGNAVIFPQLFFNWYHEFGNDQRMIEVEFVQDNRQEPKVFSYATDDPDRDFFDIGGNLSILISNNIQPFASIQALVGHDFFDSVIVSLGVRADF